MAYSDILWSYRDGLAHHGYDADLSPEDRAEVLRILDTAWPILSDYGSMSARDLAWHIIPQHASPEIAQRVRDILDGCRPSWMR